MLIINFKENCSQYENFAVWDVESMDAFFKGNAVILEVFESAYNMSVDEFEEERSEILKTDMQVMEDILDQIGDKHFFIFTFHGDNHWELVQMQTQKIMNFGLDIETIAKDHVFILTMDRKAS
jgi:hypothetical protein